MKERTDIGYRSFFKDLFIFVLMCVVFDCMYACMCTMYIPVTQGGQKRTSDTMELEWKKVV